MDFSSRRERRTRPIAYIVLAATLAIYVLQLRSLYVVPVADSVRWGGDETWLMREFGNQARHGVMSYPESFGGPQRTDGLLAGSMWVNALIYGVPGNILSPHFDLVSIGRTVTAILGLLLIASLFVILRRLGIKPIIAACAIGIVAISQGFVCVVHCSRYDLLTGLTLLWFVFLLARFAANELTVKKALLLGITSAALILFSRHLLTLPLGAVLCFVLFTRLWQNRKALASFVLGAFATYITLGILYYAGAGEFSLFGRGGTMGSFSFVLQQIPIARPFSRNVQVSNLLERLHLFATDAPGVLLVLIAAVVMVFVYKLWQ